MEAAEPRIIFEVLSPSTTRYDRFQKLEEYKLHPHIRVVLLIDTESPRVTVWRRDGGGWDYREKTGVEALIELPEVEVILPLSALYLDLSFDPIEG